MMTLNKNLLGLLVALAIAAWCYWGFFGGKKTLDVALIDGRTMTIVPRVHLIGGLGPSVAYIIETSQGLVAIDSGLDANAGLFKSELAKLKLDWKTLRAIFLTHAHGDHTGGAQRLSDETGAKIYAGAQDVFVIETGEPREAVFSTFRMPNQMTHPTHVDVEVHDKAQYRFGNALVKVLETPGHTPGSTCYLVELDGLRILFSGDVIMRLGGRRLGTYSAYLAPRYRGDAETFLHSLTKLRELPVPELVLPGHPVADGGERSPRLTQDEWDEMLEQGVAEMRRLVQQIESNGANFLDCVPKRLLPDLYYLGDREGLAVYVFLVGSRVVLIDTPGGPGLDQFVITQLRELGIYSPNLFAVLLTACGDRETAGLAELVEQHQVHVASSPEGIALIRQRLPAETNFTSAEELSLKEGISLVPIRLAGLGNVPIAYSLRWTGKNVLFSGRMLETARKQSEIDSLSRSANSDVIPEQYMNSIKTLANQRPDLWLPAQSTDSQNANLYGNEWDTILQANYHHAMVMRLRSPVEISAPKGLK